MLAFNVKDDYAFDIDETVHVDVEFYVQSASSSVEVSYDGNESAPGFLGTSSDPATFGLRARVGTLHKQRITLPRARFANLAFAGSDVIIRNMEGKGLSKNKLVICGLSLERSYTTRTAAQTGTVSIEIVDERGNHTPARVGIYDSSGRLPLPSNDALLVRTLNGIMRIVPHHRSGMPWPLTNRSVFYVDGKYEARLPVGRYDFIAAKGPEYRLVRQHFTVDVNEAKSVKINLRRWRDMAADGWYSGDGHIHYARNSILDDRTLQVLAQAEDLKVSNILQMGNNAKIYFPQHEWKPLSAQAAASFVLVPGQEDPRTTHRGHALALNIPHPLRSVDRYLLYDEVFEQARRQGGVTGYAHVVDPIESSAGTMRGMAVDVPLGLIDLAEIMSPHRAGTAIWFDFLNLGYRLSPCAGTDFPFSDDVPGIVRSYVHIEMPFTPQRWFDALKSGRTFVTNGPMLEMSVNRQHMGSEIEVGKGHSLIIEAHASINPDIGPLVGLELIEQGASVKTVTNDNESTQLGLQYHAIAKHGTWFVVRAYGKAANTLAISAPIYVTVDGESFWKPAAVPAIVARLKLAMQEMLQSVTADSTEEWDTRAQVARHWSAQRPLLRERVKKANAIYDDLVRRAGEQRGRE